MPHDSKNGCDPAAGLTVFLVGGALRDALLGLPEHERDWVVVGADEKVMRAAGFQSVGRHFPVFIHPQPNTPNLSLIHI